MTSLPKRFRSALVAAGLFGVTGVAFGAMGAHALSARLAERGTAGIWETAATYHLFHAVALFAAAVWLRAVGGWSASANRIVWAVMSWCAGILLFSGSIYWLALGGPRWLGPVTPIGGVALMLGWVFLIAAAVTRDSEEIG
jgi:uncharacterized membrane protein YgdD (TMEM256/DUF423 family)